MIRDKLGTLFSSFTRKVGSTMAACEDSEN